MYITINSSHSKPISSADDPYEPDHVHQELQDRHGGQAHQPPPERAQRVNKPDRTVSCQSKLNNGEW